MSAPVSEPDLTFQWPTEKGFPFVLFFCVLGSLLAHGATFVLFQVVYPERVTIPHPAPRVSLLTPTSPENIALLRWIEAEDPALIASESPVRPPSLVEVRYRPSFAEPRTDPLGAPDEAQRQIPFPPAVDRLVAREVAPVAPAPASSTPLPTTIRFTGGLSSRSLENNPPLEFANPSTAPARPSEFLIGVDASGVVRFRFLQEASGDPSLDSVATAHLEKLRFAAAESPVTWGHAMVIWSLDAYAIEAPAPATP